MGRAHLVTYRVNKTHLESYVIAARHNVSYPSSVALLPSVQTDMVDGGHGIVICLALYYKDQLNNCLLLFRVDFSTGQGHYVGVKTPSVWGAQFYSIAVDADKELLYVGHDGYVSVHTLLYESQNVTCS